MGAPMHSPQVSDLGVVPRGLVGELVEGLVTFEDSVDAGARVAEVAVDVVVYDYGVIGGFG